MLIDEKQKSTVEMIGDDIGYGRLMQLAEQIWKEKAESSGGEHTVGPCAFFMTPCKHWIKDDNGHCEICCGAGRVTKGVARYMEATKREEFLIVYEDASIKPESITGFSTALKLFRKRSESWKEQSFIEVELTAILFKRGE